MLELIRELGFPVVMCILMFHQNNTVIKELKSAVDTLTLAIAKSTIKDDSCENGGVSDES